MMRSRPRPEVPERFQRTPYLIVSALVLDILPWLAAFFVLDALVHLRRGQVVIAREGLGGPRPLRGGLRLAGLSPFGLAAVAYELPFILTDEGLWLEDPDNASPPVVREEALTFLSYEALGEVEAVRSAVRAQGRMLFRTRSVADAQRWAALLNRLRAESAEVRRDTLAQWDAEAFDVAAARQRWERMRRPWALTAVAGTLEALVLFGVLPWLATRGEVDASMWMAALASLLLLHLLAVGFAGWTLARGGRSRAERGAALFTLVVFPAYAARAGVQVVREAFSHFEPLVLASVFLRRDAFLTVARREWARTAESARTASSTQLVAFFESRLKRVEKAISEAGCSLEELRASPAEVPAQTAWCPICGCAHRPGFKRCADCDVALMGLGEEGARVMPEGGAVSAAG